jgi:D-alanyl-D-alanine carboxypeptidase/D-alanyl-D-alanine-endopeptidase (penicillin-binding protein 4)
VDQLNRWYCAEVGGLNFHTNCLSFFFDAGRDAGVRPGEAPAVRLQPRVGGVGDWLNIDNKGKVVKDGRHTAWVARAAGARPANDFTVFGNVRSGGRRWSMSRCTTPALFFGRLLAERLGDRGVRTAPDERGLPRVSHAGADEVRRFRARGGRAHGDDRCAAAFEHQQPEPLHRGAAQARRARGDARARAPGRAGPPSCGCCSPTTWARATRRGRSSTTGRGMSRGNRVAPETLTAWLGSLARRPGVGPALRDSLPGPGSGTLRRRFRGAELTNELRAKTGSINGVRCLSGWSRRPTGRTRSRSA